MAQPSTLASARERISVHSTEPYSRDSAWPLPGAISTDAAAQARAAETNRALQSAGEKAWNTDGPAGQLVALRLFSDFGHTVSELERFGWPAERIRVELEPARQVFATSEFMRRCQQWPRGQAGDFETIEYLTAGVNHSAAGSIGWHFEEIVLRSPIAMQHLNKLDQQSQEIRRVAQRNDKARILSIGCGGCLDWAPILPSLHDFAGEIALNDCDSAALDLAMRRLQPVANRIQLWRGNILRVVRELGKRPPFDLVVAGGLFDYLDDRAAVFLLKAIYSTLLARRGSLFFTNIGEGNPWRKLMEYGSNWNLIERTETQIRRLCHEAGIDPSAVSMDRDSTELTILATVVRI